MPELVDLSGTQFWEIGARLRQARQMLDQLQAMMRASSAVAREIGRDVIHGEQRYGALVYRYQQFRVAVGLQPQTGLGAVPAAVAAVAWVAGAIAVQVAAVTVLVAYLQSLKEMGEKVALSQDFRASGRPGEAARVFRDSGNGNWLTKFFTGDVNWLLLGGIVLGGLLLGRKRRR